MSSTQRIPWSRDEQLLALRLYSLLRFGQLSKGQHDVVQVANAIGRTPSAVAMKACNFASLDPALDRKGLGNISQSDKVLWLEFMSDSETIAAESERLFQDIVLKGEAGQPQEKIQPDRITESIQTVKVRRVQSFFRRAVMVSYSNRCALTGISNPTLLIASHIIPWSVNEKRRADPTNGIALNSLHDRLFDQGLMTIDADYRVVLSTDVKENIDMDEGYRSFFDIEGEKLKLPERFRPDPEALSYHREQVFLG